MTKIKIQAYVELKTAERFYQTVAKVYGKTSGGAVSKAVEEAIKEWCDAKIKGGLMSDESRV